MVSEAASSADRDPVERFDPSGEPAGADDGGDAREAEPSAGSPEGSQTYLFSGIGVSSALEELQQVFERKLRGLQSREDEALARQLRQAHELARRTLASAFERGRGEPPTVEVK